MLCYKGHFSFIAVTKGQCLTDVIGNLPLNCRSQHFVGVHGDIPTPFSLASDSQECKNHGELFFSWQFKKKGEKNLFVNQSHTVAIVKNMKSDKFKQ